VPQGSRDWPGRELPFPGAVDHGGHVTFTLYLPRKQSVHVIGDFNDWRPDADPLREIAEGLWSFERELPRGTFSYQFLVDQHQIICDPYARYVERDPGEGPQRAIVKPREDPYLWKHDSWGRPRFQDLLIYELHVADFTPQRDLREAATRLEYVRDLGVNAIELMPVFSVHEHAGWGYTPTYLFACNEDYGTPNDLRWLIDEAHGRDIAVILDIVLAHTGQDHPFNQLYSYDESPWYGEGPAGGHEFALPQLDYSKPATRRFAKDVLEYWLNDFHVDGFRFDYIKSIGVTRDGHGISTLVAAARAVREDVFLIGEHVPENAQLMLDCGLDGAWHVRFCHALRALLTERDVFDNRPHEFERVIQVLDPQHEGYGQKPSCMVNYLESHDEERIALALKRAGCDEHTARVRAALGATVLFTVAGEPMLYQGQDWGQASPRNMDHNYIEWAELETPGGRGLRDHYRRLAWLRRSHGALRTANFAFDVVSPGQRSVVYRRWEDSGDEVIVAANFSGDRQRLGVPLPGEGAWKEFFTEEVIQASRAQTRELGPWTAEIFVREP
jgi:1,4-alpha-glucan branching enzyme